MRTVRHDDEPAGVKDRVRVSDLSMKEGMAGI